MTIHYPHPNQHRPSEIMGRKTAFHYVDLGGAFYPILSH